MRIFRAAAALLGLAYLMAGCFTAPPTPAQHKVLTFFFDGVPPLDQWEESQARLRWGPTPEELAALAAKQAGEERGEKGEKIVRVLHPPYRDGQCQSCHAPEEGKFLRYPKGKLCFVCHTDKAKYPFVHGPAAVGACLLCHHPHQTPHPALLLVAGQPLCLGCHEDTMDLGKPSHAAMGEETACYLCHSPHGGNVRFFLKGPVTPPPPSVQKASVKAREPLALPMPLAEQGGAASPSGLEKFKPPSH